MTTLRAITLLLWCVAEACWFTVHQGWTAEEQLSPNAKRRNG